MNDPNEINILLIEDNEGDIRLVKEVLRDLDIVCRLTVIKNGEAAWESVNSPEVRTDFIILDLNIPRKNGREILRELKTQSQLKSIPVVVLSSSDLDEDINQSYQNYANCYIQKPIDLDHFTNAIRSLAEFWFKIVKLPTKPS